MSNYIFEKIDTIRLNGRNVNAYNVYQTKIDEVSEIRDECERPGVTVATSESKIIKVNADEGVKLFVGKAHGKNKADAEERFFNSEL